MSASSYAARIELAKVDASPASNGAKVSVPIYPNALANVFCRCGGVRVPYRFTNLGRKRCECTTPERSWARLTWRERFDAWLQDDSHVPNSLTWLEVIEYRVGKFSVTPRTLSQSGSGKTPAFCTVPVIDVEFERYRRECIKDAIEYLSKL